MAYIYKITNLLNGKVYIGKTLCSIHKRWLEHCSDSKKEERKNRPLYRAMNKYGIDNFSIEEVEECSDKIVNKREVYWIEYYQSFKYGYNATIGGDGKHYLDYDLICETYNQVQNITETAKICNCHADSVRKILRERKIDIVASSVIAKQKYSKMINQFSLQGEYIKTFSSVSDAARYIQSLAPEKRTGLRGIATHISAAAQGKRKTAYKFIWKFTE